MNVLQVKILKRFMTDAQLKKLESQYRSHIYGRKAYVPTEQDLKLYESYRVGRVEITHLTKEWKLKNHSSSINRIGRIVGYLAQASKGRATK